MHRITKADLQQRIDTLNEMTGQPMEPWNPVRREDGGLAANVGHYHLDWTYGGVGVDQMHNVGGGVVDIIPRGTKRETYNRLGALIQGIRLGQQTAPPVHVVAAAPELLAALDGMLDQFEDNEQYCDDDAAVIATAREAIAQATGGEA